MTKVPSLVPIIAIACHWLAFPLVSAHAAQASPWQEVVRWNDTVLIRQEAEITKVRYSLDAGKTFSPSRRVDYELDFFWGKFDPLDGLPEMPETLAPHPETKLILVQFHGPAIPPWTEAIESAGGQFVQAQSGSALVYLFKDEAPGFPKFPFVRAVVPYAPALKLHAGSVDLLRADSTPDEIHLVLVDSSSKTRSIISDLALSFGAIEIGHSNGRKTLGFSLLAGSGNYVLLENDLVAGVTLRSNQFILESSTEELLLGTSSVDGIVNTLPQVVNIMGGDTLHAVDLDGDPPTGGFSPNAIRVEVFDGDMEEGNPVLSGRHFYSLDANWVIGIGTARHGGKVFSTVMSDGTGFPDSKAALPGAIGFWAPKSEVPHGNPHNRFLHRYPAIQDPSPIFPIPLIEPCVWVTSTALNNGKESDSSYNTDSFFIDDAIMNTVPGPGVSAVLFAGNEGWTTTSEWAPRLSSDAWAKNVISVGAIRRGSNIIPFDLSSDFWWGNETIGTGFDPGGMGRFGSDSEVAPNWSARVKPDIVGFNSGVKAVAKNSTAWVESNFPGTSSATPQVAGHVGLIYQMWGEGLFGNSIISPSDYYDSRPPISLIKAFLINSSRPYPIAKMPPSATNEVKDSNSILRANQGWGLPNLHRLYHTRLETYYEAEANALHPDTKPRYTVYLQSASTGPPPDVPDELRITLVYNDDPGAVTMEDDLVHDLTLRVVDENGNIYWGNFGLWEKNESKVRNEADLERRDNRSNVENVWIPNFPLTTNFRVDIFADELVNVPSAGWPFSLVASRCQELTFSTDTITLVGDEVIDTGISPGSGTYTFSGAPANAAYWIGSSEHDFGHWNNGHPFDIGLTYTVESSGTTSATGTGSWTTPVLPPSMAGTTFYLEVGVSSGGSIFDSNMLEVSVL